MNIQVRNIVNADVAFSSELGHLVRDSYGATWRSELIVLDFEGMRNVSPSFLSQALMPILESTSMDKLAERVQFEHVPNGFEFVLDNIKKAMSAKKSRGAA
jgi:hypothetical protein